MAKISNDQCVWLLKNLIEIFSILKTADITQLNPDTFLILFLLPPLVDSQYKANNVGDAVFSETNIDYGSFGYALAYLASFRDSLFDGIRPEDIVYSVVGLHFMLLSILEKNNVEVVVSTLCEKALSNMFDAIPQGVVGELGTLHSVLRVMRVKPLAFTLLNVFMDYQNTKNRKEALRTYKLIMKDQLKLTIDF